MEKEKLLELKNITKLFTSTLALSEANFDLYPGEVHALLGENGAGKSTMIKIITGIYKPDIGDIFLSGEKVIFRNPQDSYEAGIAAFYQEANLFQELSIAENIFMGHHDVYRATKTINWNNIFKKADALIKELGVKLNSHALVKSLGIAEKQLVEIIKALSSKSKILIMDEPTSALTAEEVKDLFTIIKRLRENGTGIIFVSHRLQEIFEIADRATVLRDGKIVGSLNKNELDEQKLIKMMVGRTIDNLYPKEKVKIDDDIVLKVENLKRVGEFEDISFNLRKGEILGFAGLIGSGRTEVARSIFGAEKIEGGKIYLDGKEVHINNPRDALDLGIAYLSESRGEYGLVLQLDITKNITLPNLKKFQRFGFLNKKKENKIAKIFYDLLDIRAKGLNTNVEDLSGGNQQKVSIAKCLATNAKVLLLDEPTRGIDIGTKAAVHKAMSDLAKERIAILMISSELPEIIGMSDRVLIMHEGHIKTELNKEELSQEKILSAAIGQ